MYIGGDLVTTTRLATTGMALLAVVVLAVAGHALLLSQTAHAQIAGEWDLDITSGAGVASCTAAISETGGSFEMVVACPDLGGGSLAGDIERETGEFLASGTIFGFSLDIEGVASAAGDSIVGTWTSDSPGNAGTFRGARKVPPTTPTPTPTPRPTLPAPIDLSGTWDIEFRSIVNTTCIALFEQYGGALSMLAVCDFINGEIKVAGTIDPVTGAFSIKGHDIEVEGLVAADGNSLSGVWTFDPGFVRIAGKLEGQRSDAIEVFDLSGDWTLALGGDLAATCNATFVHSRLDLTAFLDCGELGSGESTFGSAHPLTGEFTLGGSLGEIEIFLLFGSRDGPGLRGGWGGLNGVGSGRMYGVPSDQAHRGVTAVICQDKPGLERECKVGFDSDVSVQVVAVLPPAAGFAGFQVGLDKDGNLLYTPTADPATEAIWPGCVAPVRDITMSDSGESVLFSCHPDIILSPDTEAGPLLELAMACLEPGEATLVLQPGDEAAGAGTLFSIGDGSQIAPLLFDETVICSGLPGDANCDGTADSLDAALVLQYVAGLLYELPCQDLADADGDRVVTSVDAALILQYESGLIEAL